MAILCRDLNLLFVLTPATGSTAIAGLLQSEFDGFWLPGDKSGPVRQKHSALRELMDTALLTRQERERLCVVTSVRNPYDRLVSIYYKRRGVTPESLADPEFWMNQSESKKARADALWIQKHTFTEWVRHRFLRSWLPRRLRGRSRRRVAVRAAAGRFRQYARQSWKNPRWIWLLPFLEQRFRREALDYFGYREGEKAGKGVINSNDVRAS